MGNPLNYVGCLPCFFVDPINIDHYLTGLFQTNLRLILRWLPIVSLGGRLRKPHINLSIQKTYVGLIWAIHDVATQLDIDLDWALILNRATAYSQKFSLTGLR